jgi:ABC-type transport system involved in cytochrome c biogenesis ATPase subunit
VGRLDDIGLDSYFGEGKWKLTKGSLILARGAKQGCLYVTKTKLCKTDVNIVERDSNIELWHKRLGHMSEKGLHSLAHKDFLPELKGMTLKPCVDYLAGKQHRIAFRTSTVPHCAKNILDFVYTDVCSMTKSSFSGALYFVTFIDDDS